MHHRDSTGRPNIDPSAAFIWQLRVYYEDTDAGGVVYYANYLKFFERCRTEWLRALGVDQSEFAREQGLGFVVTELQVRYLRPAYLDDQLSVEARVTQLGRCSLVFLQHARRAGELLAQKEAAAARGARRDTLRANPAGLASQWPRGRPGPLRPVAESGPRWAARTLASMNVSADLSILSLVTQATLVVQFVMALLLLVSLASWTAIFSKALSIRRANRETEAFERRFWSGANLDTLHQAASNPRHKTGALERIFEAGMSEFLKLRGRGQEVDRQAMLDGARRAMRASYQREMDALEARLSFLASAGSVSPYVGLFGTVWGIMHAFTGLSGLQQATLASVAPGIAEALIATAIGLFAAIPAVVAYNRFAHDIDRLANRFESFTEEFSNILQRQR